MSEIFLIDGNGIGFAAHSGSKLTVGDQQTQAVFGFVRTMRAMTLQYPGSYKVVLWDGGSSWRKVVYPDYKENREKNAVMKKMRDAYRSQRPFIFKALKHLGIDQMVSPEAEADDIAAALAQKFSVKMGKKVRLITGDKDWLQLVNQNCTWHDPREDKIITLDNFSDATDLARPQQIVDLKALMGDTSDNIKGCGGIGEVHARKLLKVFGSVPKFLKINKDNEFANLPKPWERLLKNEDGRLDRYHRNVQLVNLLGAAKPGVEKRELTKGQFNPDAFNTLAEELAFHSITANLDTWLAPFAKRITA